MWCSVASVCDHISHSHVCCHCSEHHNDCEHHTKSFEHDCADSDVDLLVYIIPQQSQISFVYAAICTFNEILLEEVIAEDDSAHQYWIRNDILYDSPIHTRALLRAPPALV